MEKVYTLLTIGAMDRENSKIARMYYETCKKKILEENKWIKEFDVVGANTTGISATIKLVTPVDLGWVKDDVESIFINPCLLDKIKIESLFETFLSESQRNQLYKTLIDEVLV